MALEAGKLSVTLEFAKDLADKDWFGKQDPYCILTFGSQKVKSKTHIDGGRNPVWNETFEFQAINDNTVTIQIYDEDIGKDDFIGSCTLSCAKAREQGHDRVQAPVQTKKGKQKGMISVGMRFAANNDLKQPQQQPSQQPPPHGASGYHQYPPQGYAPPPQGYAPPPPGYAPPPYPYPPPGYGHPPPQYGAPPPPYYQYPPGAPPPGPHGHPPPHAPSHHAPPLHVPSHPHPASSHHYHPPPHQ